MPKKILILSINDGRMSIKIYSAGHKISEIKNACQLCIFIVFIWLMKYVMDYH